MLMKIMSSLFQSVFNRANHTKRLSLLAKRDPVVSLYRHVRFKNTVTRAVDSNSGMTFKIDLDYDAGTISYRAVMCNEDNFSRKRGRDLVDLSTRGISTIPMTFNCKLDKYTIDSCGVIGMIFNYLFRFDIYLNETEQLYKRYIQKMYKQGYFSSYRWKL